MTKTTKTTATKTTTNDSDSDSRRLQRQTSLADRRARRDAARRDLVKQAKTVLGGSSPATARELAERVVELLSRKGSLRCSVRTLESQVASK